MLLRMQYRKLFCPNSVILSVAGNIEWEPLKAQVERLFGGWSCGDNNEVIPQRAQAGLLQHIDKDTQQTQIALAFPSVSVTDRDYYNARSGGGGAVRWNEFSPLHRSA